MTVETIPESALGGEGDGFTIIECVQTKGKNTKTILNKMKLDFPENGVTAILGPSGCGKTTLLSVITDSVQTNVTCRAHVYLPGHDAFVPQDDRLHGFYTCKSYMMHYAKLTGLSKQDGIEERIDDLLKQLGLSNQSDTIVGDLFLKGLSGGQKRRLSIALETLTYPENFFLDEPTSGLDAESALQIMEFLKNYSRGSKNRRVILTIHQPSSFIWEIIDHVILLSKGQLMYNGSRKNMENFFDHAGYPTPAGWNCADHYVTAVNDEFHNHALSVDVWANKFSTWKRLQNAEKLQSKDPKSRQSHRTASMRAVSHKIETARSNSILVAFELVHRYFLNLIFNPGILGTRIAMYSMLALMVGALFWDLGKNNNEDAIYPRAAVLFYCVAFFIFMSVAVLPFTVMERGIVDKEVANKYYHPFMYQIAQAVSSIPGAAILAFVVTLFIMCMTKMNDPFWYFLTMFLSLCVAEALAQMVSHVVPHFVIGMAMIAGLYGFFMLYQGFMLTKSQFPDWLEWLYYVAPHSYAWRTFMYSEFSGEEFVDDNGNVVITGEQVLTNFEIEDTDRASDMIVLVGYTLVVHCFSFVILKLRYSMFKGKIEPLSDDFDAGEISVAGKERMSL